MMKMNGRAGSRAAREPTQRTSLCLITAVFLDRDSVPIRAFTFDAGIIFEGEVERPFVAISDMLAAWSIADGTRPPSFFGADIR